MNDVAIVSKRPTPKAHADKNIHEILDKSKFKGFRVQCKNTNLRNKTNQFFNKHGTTISFCHVFDMPAQDLI